MAGYFEVKVDSFTSSNRGSWDAKILVISHGGFKGTVDLEFDCVDNSTPPDSEPELDMYSDSVYIDQGNNASTTVIVTGDPGFSFSVCGYEHGGSLSDCDSKSGP